MTPDDIARRVPGVWVRNYPLQQQNYQKENISNSKNLGQVRSIPQLRLYELLIPPYYCYILFLIVFYFILLGYYSSTSVAIIYRSSNNTRTQYQQQHQRPATINISIGFLHIVLFIFSLLTFFHCYISLIPKCPLQLSTESKTTSQHSGINNSRFWVRLIDQFSFCVQFFLCYFFQFISLLVEG